MRRRIRGRDGVVLVDERLAKPLAGRLNAIGAEPVEAAPALLDRFDNAVERLLQFTVTKALWAVIAICGALVVVMVVGAVVRS